jgi:arylsulfatase A-like enzyme
VTKNIVEIVLDDCGREQFPQYQVGGVTGGLGRPYPSTPTLAALAAGGRLFERAFVHPFCSPTRAAHFTGRFPGRNGVGNIIENDSAPALFDSELTFVEVLREQRPDIRCGAFGKWHLGNAYNGDLTSPLRAGFEIFSGTRRNLPPQTASADPTISDPYYNAVWNVNGEERLRLQQFLPTAMVSDALRWLRTLRGQPFYLYLPFHLPHSPFVRPPATHYDTSMWTLPHAYAVGQGNPDELWPYFKAMIEACDYEIARFIDQMPPGEFVQTTFFVYADNGTTSEAIANNAGSSPDHAEYNGQAGVYWDAAKAKRSTYDSGIQVPMFVYGPAITAQAGLPTAGLVQIEDVSTTILELFGCSWPDQRRIDAVSFKKLLSSPGLGSDRTKVWGEIFAPNGRNAGTSIGRRCVRTSQYKLMFVDGPLETAQRRFYDLIADPMELTNLTPGGSTSGLSAPRLAAYTDMLEYAEDLVATFDDPVGFPE